ncbi:hypothetical protein AgCh_035590 [Apium graveolens]
MDKYEFLKNIGAGSFGLTKLMRNKITKELVAMKFIQRDKINANVEREIINHRSLRHPNIVRFTEVQVTPTYIVIVMEYAAGGELHKRIITAKTLGEDEQMCHRDLKLANILLDGSSVPILKICHFGFSKSSEFHSAPDSPVGTLAYSPPELIESGSEYDGKLADVWSCGVTLYTMLVGEFPFTDQEDPANWSQIMQRILCVQYKIPDSVDISQDCRHLLSRIFVSPASRVQFFMESTEKRTSGLALPILWSLQRITIEEIKNHPWFLKNLPWKESEAAQSIYYRNENSASSSQTLEGIMEIVGEARQPEMYPYALFNSLEGSEREKGEYNNDEEQNLKKDYEDRHAKETSGQKLVRPELYMTHARKRSRYSSDQTVPAEFTNLASMEIAIRYANILDQNRSYFTQVGNYEDMTKLIEWWIPAAVPENHKPSKNLRIASSRVPAKLLLTDLEARYNSESSDSSSSTATGWAKPSAIPDIIFVQVVCQVLQNAQANLPMYSKPPSYKQVTTLARAALEIGDSDSQSTRTFSADIIEEVIEVVGNILADIYEKYVARTQELQARARGYEDFVDETTEMDEDTDNGNADRDSLNLAEMRKDSYQTKYCYSDSSIDQHLYPVSFAEKTTDTTKILDSSMSGVRSAERSIDLNILHSYHSHPSASQSLSVRSAERSIESNVLNLHTYHPNPSAYQSSMSVRSPERSIEPNESHNSLLNIKASTQVTNFNPSMSDVRPAERSIELNQLHYYHFCPSASEMQPADLSQGSLSSNALESSYSEQNGKFDLCISDLRSAERSLVLVN